MSLFLIRLGELTLKKGSRGFFEATLKRNITQRLKGIAHELKISDGRYYLSIQDNAYDDFVSNILSKTFGITDFHKAFHLPLSMPEIEDGIARLLVPLAHQPASFKIECRRINKSFTYNSYETCTHLGQFILQKYPNWHVDVHQPDWTIIVEIRESCYVYIKAKNHQNAGAGGLPVGTAGRGLLLLSGGIDSPVAGWMMACRGLQLLAVHFHTPPYTGCEALQKARDLAQGLADWNINGNIVLFLVNFTQIQLKIRETADPRYGTILARSCMMQIAEKIAQKEGASVLITGEALAQVASQTLDSLAVTDQSVHMLILRPLIGMDKQDIIEKAKYLDSFRISVQSGTDCCALFAPENPVTKPKMNKVQQQLEAASLEELIHQAAQEAQREIISSQECSPFLKE